MWNLIAASGAFVFVAGLSGVLVFASLWVSHSAYTWYRGATSRPETPEEMWSETSTEARLSEEEWAVMMATILPPELVAQYADEDEDVEK